MVSTVETVQGKGLYTIVTKEEYVVVNGIIASPFAVNHMLANLYYNVHRLVYASAPSLLNYPPLHFANEVINLHLCVVDPNQLPLHPNLEIRKWWWRCLYNDFYCIWRTIRFYYVASFTSIWIGCIWLPLCQSIWIVRFLDQWFLSRGSPLEDTFPQFNWEGCSAVCQTSLCNSYSCVLADITCTMFLCQCTLHKYRISSLLLTENMISIKPGLQRLDRNII